MAETKIFKVSALPQVLVPNGIYLVSETPGIFSIKVANSAGDGILNQVSEIGEVNAEDIADATAIGQSLMTAESASVGRNALEIGEFYNWLDGDFEYFKLTTVGRGADVVIGSQVPAAPDGVLWTAGMLVSPSPGPGEGGGTIPNAGRVFEVQSDGTKLEIASNTQSLTGKSIFNRILDFTYYGCFLFTLRGGGSKRMIKLSRHHSAEHFFTEENLSKSTVETKLRQIGLLSDLETEQSSTIVAAINFLNGKTTVIDDEPPEFPSPGQKWIRGIGGIEYTWYVNNDAGQWVEFGPGASNPEIIEISSVVGLTETLGDIDDVLTQING